MTDKHTPGPTASEIEQLKSTIANYTSVLGKQLNEIRRLESTNAELLKALEAFLNSDPSVSHMKVTYENACLAVAHAKGDA